MNLHHITRIMMIVLMPALMLGFTRIAPNTDTCEGYRPRRVWIDTQVWWIQTPGQGGSDFGHVHLATCFPLYQSVSGQVPFEFLITMHNNPGRLGSVDIDIPDAQNIGTRVAQLALVEFNPPLTCPIGQTCQWRIPIVANTTLLPYDGRQTWRLHALVAEPDGKHMLISSGHTATISNGRSIVDSVVSEQLEGKSWYTGADYARTVIRGTPVPNRPVRKPFPIRFYCASDSPYPLSECLVTVDPDFHNGYDGTALLRLANPTEVFRTITIDMSQFSIGFHRLAFRGCAPQPNGSTLCNITAFKFNIP